jgi:tRNA(Ile)-lysidine synthase
MMPLCGELFMHVFENQISADALGLFAGIDRVLLAVSGGADSAALAHVLAELKAQGRLSCEFVIGHVNHCLRGADSDADEEFVRTFAESLAIPFAVRAVDVKAYAQKHKLSIETAGRKLRLPALKGMAEEHRCRRIATAHHADDQAETLIHRMMRGTGFRGLAGIRPVSMVDGAVYVRPMLNVRREEILQYCQDHGIFWRQDKSNSDLQFTRNRIRHRLLPQLQAGSDLTELLAKLSTAAQGLQHRVDDALKDSLKELCAGEHGFSEVCFHQEKLNACSPWTFYEIIRQGVVTIGGGLRGYSRSHFDAIRQMTDQSKARADFPGKLEVIVENDTVTIQRKGYKPPKGISVEGELMFPGDTVEFGPWKISSRPLRADQADIDHFLETKDDFIEWFDADKIAGPLIIRQRETGDRFWPIGAEAPKKVGRFLIDAGLDAKTKRQAFIVCDTEKILWVAPVRMSDRAKITPETQHILEMRLSEVE